VSALARSGPLVIVHGGGREIDAELARRHLDKLMVDGLRVTDAATLERWWPCGRHRQHPRGCGPGAAAVRAVGLTGADAPSSPPSRRAHRTVDGRVVGLGLVGRPAGADVPSCSST